MLNTARQSFIPHRLPAPISGSWERCYGLGLRPEQPAEMERPADYDVRQMLQRGAELLTAAEAELRPLASALTGTGHVAFVVDDLGFVVAVEGDQQRAGAILGRLQCGVNLSEASFGTNAAGMVLVERKPTLVRRGEHFLSQLSALDCFAAPITSPHGRLLGALTVSNNLAPQVPGVTELTQVAVARMERQLVCALGSPLLIRLHPHVEGIGSSAEGVIAVSTDGEVLGLNSAASRMLGVEASALIGQGLDPTFNGNPLRTMSLTGKVSVLRVRNGLGLSARLVRNAIVGKPRAARRSVQVASTGQAGDLRAVEKLSERELRVVRELETGASNAEIGQRLHISDDAVKYHLKNVFSKIGASSRLEAIKICRELGVLP